MGLEEFCATPISKRNAIHCQTAVHTLLLGWRAPKQHSSFDWEPELQETLSY